MTNIITLVGRLTKDAQYTGAESYDRTRVTLAVNPSGNKAQFIDMTAWGDTAKQMQTLQKGKKVKIVGRVKNKVSEQKGVKDYNYEFVVVSFTETDEKDKCLVEIEGNLTKDPELTYTSTGKPVAKYSIAANSPNGKATYLNGSAWEEKAVDLADNYRKGEKVKVSLGIKQLVSERQVPNSNEVVKFYGYDFNFFKVEKVEKNQQQQQQQNQAQEERMPWDEEVVH